MFQLLGSIPCYNGIYYNNNNVPMIINQTFTWDRLLLSSLWIPERLLFLYTAKSEEERRWGELRHKRYSPATHYVHGHLVSQRKSSNVMDMTLRIFCFLRISGSTHLCFRGSVSGATVLAIRVCFSNKTLTFNLRSFFLLIIIINIIIIPLL